MNAWSFADRLFQSFLPANSSPDRDSSGRLAGGRTVQILRRVFRKKPKAVPNLPLRHPPFKGMRAFRGSRCRSKCGSILPSLM
ncbi:hypothetical protein B4135_4254 [Caldibacillus debilis]|uniref:Uncharacterized protein n=1 Tax=Caldibacillus debilis TaxID=301148 RepID=A0A150L5I5_9BACI|nr:hypothetical protein B4135_4254 [Caldibacillus debilis]